MTIEEAKRDLPWIMVKWGRQKYTGRVTGRLNDQASVSVYCLIDGRVKHPVPILGPIFHVPWGSVAKSATHNRVLDLAGYEQIGIER